jgi:hypothetical protein
MVVEPHCWHCKDIPLANANHALTFPEVFLDTIQLCDHSHWTPPYLELQGHQYGKLSGAGTQIQPVLMDRLMWSGQDFERLPAAIPCITIRLGSTTSFLTRQASHSIVFFSRCNVLTVGKDSYRTCSTV